MLHTVIVGDTSHIPLLHPPGKADLLPRHALCQGCLRLHYTTLFYSTLGVSREEGEVLIPILLYYILLYSNLLYSTLLYSTLL